MRTYTRQQIEENIAEYAFGRLSPSENDSMAAALQQYPDLQNSVDLLREFALQCSARSYNEHIDRRVRNTSVGVVTLMNREGRKGTRSNSLRRYSVAAMAIVTFMMFVVVDTRQFVSSDDVMSFDDELGEALEYSQMMTLTSASESDILITPFVPDPSAGVLTAINDEHVMESLLDRSLILASAVDVDDPVGMDNDVELTKPARVRGPGNIYYDGEGTDDAG